MNLSLIAAGILIVIVILALRAIIHIVPEYQRLIVFRLGSFEKTAGPGIVLLLPPPIQSVAQTVDLREFVVEIPQQTCITKDNAPISIDFLIYQKVVEPKDSFLNIQNFRQAIQGIATTTLRAVVGNIPLDDVLAKREQINEELRIKLDDITHRWGVKVTNVEIKELTPPRDVQEAMNRQLTAERTRRASVTEAEGKKASAILVFVGFNLTFFPQFLLGYLGMPRRYHEYPPEFQVLNVASTGGAGTLGESPIRSTQTSARAAATPSVAPKTSATDGWPCL